ncbi:MAG: alpha/beta fold hydrolase [Cycloclasticus sp.]
MQLTTLDTVELNFAQHGEQGPPLIILHGLFGSARNWQGIAKQLSNHFSVFTVDLRNHGSSAHADSMDYPSMAADVLGFMHQQGITEAVLIGHSMGGKVAMQLALSNPNKFTRLIVVDIAPVAYKHNFDEVLAGLYHVPIKSITSRKEADQYLAEKITTLSLRQFLLQNLVTNSDGHYQWRVNLASIEQSMPAIMGFSAAAGELFSKPSLFINGGQSSYLSARYRTTASELFPQAQFQTIDGAGHWPHVESPLEFMAYLNAFLNPQ